MLTLYFTFDNYVQVRKSLRISPAVAIGIKTRLWSMDDVAWLIERRKDQARWWPAAKAGQSEPDPKA